MSSSKKEIAKEKSKSSPVEKKVSHKILLHNGKASSNCVEFFEEFFLEVLETLGSPAEVLRTGLLPFQDAPDKPVTDGLSEHEAKHVWTMHTQRCTEVEKENRKITESGKKIFSMLFTRLSTTSREKVQSATITYSPGTRASVSMRRSSTSVDQPTRIPSPTARQTRTQSATGSSTEASSVPSVSIAVNPAPVISLPAMNDWEDVLATSDIERLVQRIWATHRGVIVAHSKAETVFNTVAQLEAIKIRHGEPLPDYRRRFEQLLKTIEAVGGAAAVPPPTMQVFRFLKGLEHVPKYREYKSIRSNQFSSAIPFPDSIAKVCDELSVYSPISVSHAEKAAHGTTETAYVVKEKKDKKKKDQKDGAKDRGAASGDKQPAEIKCLKCHQVGHYASGCAKGHGKKRPDAGEKAKQPDAEEKVNVIRERKAPVQVASLTFPVLDVYGDDDDDDDDDDDVSVTAGEDTVNAGTVDDPRSTNECVIAVAPQGERHFRLVLAQDKGPKNLGNRSVLMDSGAAVSVFQNQLLLENVRPADRQVVISGIDKRGRDGGIALDMVGDYHGVPDIYFSEDVTQNILSLSRVRSACAVRLDDEENKFVVHAPDGSVLDFHNRNNLYVRYEQRAYLSVAYVNWSASCHAPAPTEYSVVVASTVAENLRNYTARQVANATAAYRLIESLGYPSEGIVISMLNSGSILNCPVTAQDVRRAVHIWGPTLGSIRGKATIQPQSGVIEDPKPLSLQDSPIVLHVDLMFVASAVFLVSVASPLALTGVSHLGFGKGCKSADVIKKALGEQMDNLARRNFKVTLVVCDGESAVACCREYLASRGAMLEQSGSGTHVPVVERKIREIKERARAIVSTLAFRLCAQLVPHLILYCVGRINLVPHKGAAGGASPTELLLGVKPTFGKSLALKFGDYVETREREQTDRNSIFKPRTRACIALRPSGNLHESWRFLSLDTGAVVVRDSYVVLPTPDVVIKKLNVIAFRDKRGDNITVEDFSLDDMELDQLHRERVPGVEQQIPERPPNEDDAAEPDAAEAALDPGLNPAEVLDEVDPSSTPGVQDALDGQTPVEFPREPDLVSDQGVDAPADVPTTDVSDVPDVPANVPEPDVPVSTPTPPVDVPASDSQPPTPSAPYFTRAAARRNAALQREAAQLLINHISLKKARKLFPKDWKAAAIKELKTMLDMKVWKGVPRGVKKKFIRSFMFLKDKYDANGLFEKLKARLVAMETQGSTTHIHELISSPTVSLFSLFAILAIAAREGRKRVTMDVTAAYLLALIPDGEEIIIQLSAELAALLVEIDPSYAEFLQPDGTMLLQLLRALYGCVRSAKLWYDHLRAVLERFGFVVNPHDQCVFNMMIDGVQCTVVVYVDDLLITCVNQSAIDDVLAYLKKELKNITVKTDDVVSYLGMNFDFSTAGAVKISMPAYTMEVIQQAGVTGVADSPAAEYLFDIGDAPALSAAEAKEFHTLVAKLLYLAKRTRPDVLLPVQFLSTRVSAPTTHDQRKLLRVIKYLNGTVDMGIMLTGSTVPEVRAYIDASYGVHHDAKSHSGMLVTLGGGPVFVKSTKQQVVAKSSTEAELIALSDGASTVIWGREFLLAQGEPLGPAVIYQDNQSTMAMVERGGSASDRTKHIKIRYFWVKDRVDAGEVRVEYMPTDDMVADVLTKPLQGAKFAALRAMLLNWQY